MSHSKLLRSLPLASRHCLHMRVVLPPRLCKRHIIRLSICPTPPVGFAADVQTCPSNADSE
eukprot:2305609-Pleurochrysis_carterae.AAC.8